MLRVGFSHWVGKKPGEGLRRLPAVAFSTNHLGARVAPQQSPILRNGTSTLTLKLTLSQQL